MNQFIYIILFSSILFSNHFLEILEEKNKESINFMNDYDIENGNDEQKKKNQLLAMGLSGILPGAGQIYNGELKKGLAFFGLELLLWNYRENYNDKGNHYVNLYKEYADEHWSFSKWIRNYYSFQNENDPVYNAMINNDTGTYENPWDQAHVIEWSDESTDQFYNTRDNFNLIDDIFEAVCGNEFENNYTCYNDDLEGEDYFENKEVKRDHHFYEGIGKYNMFFAGWDDVRVCGVDNNDYECRWQDSDGYEVAWSNNKKYYQRTLRYKSNKKYDYAENALTAIFINHAVSMMDALFSNLLKQRNKGVNFSTTPLYHFNNQLQMEGIKFNLKW